MQNLTTVAQVFVHVLKQVMGNKKLTLWYQQITVDVSTTTDNS